MKAESNLQPNNKFEIENIIDGKCEIVFFDNIQELEPLEDNEKRYSYDTYRLKVNYRDELEQELNDNQDKYNKWLELAKNTEYNELASKVRAERNKLLAETDKEMCLDRMGLDIPDNITATNLLTVVIKVFKALREILIGENAQYRQELRDLTKQEGFPYNVVFPIKPDSKESEE